MSRMNFKTFFICFVLMAGSLFGYDDPELLWEIENEGNDDEWFSPINQDLSADNFRIYGIKYPFSKDSVNLLKFDAKGNHREEQLVFDDDYTARMFRHNYEKIYIFKDGHTLKAKKGDVEFFSIDGKSLLKYKLSGYETKNCYIDQKNKLLLVDFQFLDGYESNSLVGFDIVSGNKIYEIPYKISVLDYEPPRARIYFKDQRIIIYDIKRTLTIYDIKDGKIINRVEKFAGYVQNYDFYEIKESGDIYFLSINPGYICFMNLESGRAIANIKYKGMMSDLKSLNQVVVKKVKNLFFVIINTKSVENNFVICIDSMDSKVLWEKKIYSKRLIEFHEYEKSVILNDDNNVYCIEQATGKELWHSDGISKIGDVDLIKKLYIVYCNDSKDIIAYNPQNGSVVWNYYMTGKFVGVYNIKDDFFVCADSSNVAKIHIETGKVLWRGENLKDIYKLVYDYNENKLFTLNNNQRGVTEFDEESGRVKWRMDSAYDLVDVVYDKGKLYFVDRKNVYGVDTATGNNFLRCELGVSGTLTNLEYLKSRNQFVLFDKNKDMYIYDVKSNSISDKIELSGSACFAELKVIGKYLSVIEIKDSNGQDYVNTCMTMVDLEELYGLYSIVIGAHRFYGMSAYADLYEQTNGAYYDRDIMKNVYLFYPRMDLYKDNAMIFMNSTMERNGVYCYKMFPGKVPTSDEIKNIEIHLLNFYNKL